MQKSRSVAVTPDMFSWDDKWVTFNSRLGAREAISIADVTSI